MLQTMCLRHDVFLNQVFGTNHLISQTLLKLRTKCINRYQMPETTSNTYKPLKMTSNYVSDPVLETNQLSQHCSSYVLTSRLCLAQSLSQIDQCISCSERFRQAIASEQLNTSQPMFKQIYQVFVSSLSAVCFTNWMTILYITCVKNFSGVPVYTIEKHSDHLLSFLLQSIIRITF